MKSKIILVSVFAVILLLMVFVNVKAEAQFQIVSGPTFSSTQGYPGNTISVTLTIKNIGTTQGSYYVEAGIARNDWGGYSMISAPWWENLFSFTYWKCCSSNEFYDGAVVVLAPNEQNTITLYPKVPASSSYDHCNNQGTAWKDYGPNYVIGANACNNCYGQSGHGCILTNWGTTFTVKEKPVDKCSDGTPYGKCSSVKPKYCYSGSLIDKCSMCGCSDGYSCGYPSNQLCTTITTCGNNKIDSGEECDGSKMNSKTCITQGFTGGTLSCSSSCTFDTSSCVGGGGNTKSISLTEDAWNDATPKLMLASTCQLTSECSKKLIFDVADGYDAENYTVKCKYSTDISNTIRVAWEKENPTYKTICDIMGIIRLIDVIPTVGLILLTPDISKALCAAKYNLLGTCRATLKSGGFDYCQFTEWASLGIFSKTDKCKDGLYTLLIGLGILIIGIPLIQGSRK